MVNHLFTGETPVRDSPAKKTNKFFIQGLKKLKQLK